MRNHASPPSPKRWMRHFFRGKTARDGAVIHSKRRDIEQVVGLDSFKAELQRRGHLALENAGQIVIFCNRAPIRRIT